MGLLTPLLLFISCNKLLVSIYGIDAKAFNEDYNKDIVIKKGLEADLDVEKLYYLDSAFLNVLIDSTKYTKVQVKNTLQPLQVYFVDSLGNDLTYLLNCFYGGFPNINFNKYGELDAFPTESDSSRLVNNVLIKDRVPYIKNIKTDNQINLTENRKHKILVFYSETMGRQKKRMFKQVNVLFNKYDASVYELIHISLDQLYVGSGDLEVDY